MKIVLELELFNKNTATIRAKASVLKSAQSKSIHGSCAEETAACLDWISCAVCFCGSWALPPLCIHPDYSKKRRH